MVRLSRLVVLPAVAVMLPCAVVGVLAYQWLALEREAAARRSTTAMETAVLAWRRELKAHVLEVGALVLRTLNDWSASGPALRPPPVFSGPIDDAYLFDETGKLLIPDYDATMPARSGTRAADLLSAARTAVSSGQFSSAEKDAATIFECCAADRDEFGVAFVWYAAWLRAALYRGAAAEPQRARLIRELGELVGRGYLGTSNDVLEARLLERQLGRQVGTEDLLAAIERARGDVGRRMATARAAGRWLAQVGGTTASAEPMVGRLDHDGVSSVAVIVRAGEGRRLVMLLGSNALAAWVRSRSAHDASFDVALSGPETAPQATAGLDLPLFPEVPGLRITARARPVDVVTDRRREQLFIGATAAALLMTVAIGYLAMRDVSREMRTARLRSSFVAAVTHELKTPLASIRLLAETLRWGRARPDTTDGLLDTIVDETDRVSRLVDDVLSTSRIESGTRVYHPRMVSLAETVRSALRRVASVLSREGFHVAERIEDDRLVVSADPDALERAVVNLLDNAMKYSRRAREIRLTVGRHGADAEVSIGDDGIGVAVADQQRIFDRFYRTVEAEAETTGAGLGLALVRHFAEAHGGCVTVRSQPGLGSVFSVRLPLAISQDAAVDAGPVDDRFPARSGDG